MSVSKATRVASPLVLAGVLVAAGRTDIGPRVLPVLSVLQGPLGWVLVAAAIGLACARAMPAAPWSLPSPKPLRLFVAGSAILIGTGLFYTSRLRVSGDEPHYLLMAQSLWKEHDLDLADNLAREDFLEYTPGPLKPHMGEPRRDGRPYPAHSPGLPLLLAPVYALGGRAGCVVVLGLCGALVAVRTSMLAGRWGGSGSGADLWAWVAALGTPLFFYSFHIYTEAPSALAALLSLELLVAGASAPAAAAAALFASALPWLHVKMLPAALALGVLALARLRGRRLGVFVAVAGSGAAGLALYYEAVFGRPTPLAIYGGIPADLSGDPARALAGLLLDRSFGLIPHAPLFLLALPGLVALARRWRSTWPALLLGAAVVAPVLGWRMWWGGQCPPARFLVPLVPVLALGVAQVAGGERRGLANWRWPLLLGGGALAGFMVRDPGALLLLNRANRPTRVWAALSGDVPVGRYLPSLTLVDPIELRVAAVWLVALAFVILLHAGARRHQAADRLFRGLALPVALLLLVGVGVDGWARKTTTAAEPRAPAAVVEPSDEGPSVR